MNDRLTISTAQLLALFPDEMPRAKAHRRRKPISAPDAIPSAEPRASREQAGHTQEQAAKLIQVARRTWQDWERGIAQMPPSLLRLYRHLSGLERLPFGRARR